MPRTFKAIIFDFDGLIVDTEVPEYEAWLSIFRSYGVDLPLSVWTPHIGGGSEAFDIYDHLAELTGKPVDRDELRPRRRAAFDKLFEQAVPLPGVEDYITAARERGMGIGIASSSPRRWVDPKLKQLGLVNTFDTVVCADDVGSAKPNPASYRKALADLGVTPDEAFALEDSPTGVQGAKNAGLLCVAVPGTLTRDRSYDHADMRLESLADMPLDQLMETLS
ncbi:MAG: HAD family phosphatase [Dehalococcoidia bacterium]|nr:HAD family phosphatase [Dehalococcoidia bacterium]